MSLSDNREIVSRDDSYPTIYHTFRCQTAMRVAAALLGRPPRYSCNRVGKEMRRGEATIEELSDLVRGDCSRAVILLAIR